MNTHADKARREFNELTQTVPATPDAAPVKLLATIVSVGYNFLVVDLGGGANVSVLKPTKVTPALDQTNPKFTYTYTDTVGGQARTSTGASSPENQVVVPKFFIGGVVEVGPVPINLAAFDPSLAGYKLQVVNSPAYWSKESEG